MTLNAILISEATLPLILATELPDEAHAADMLEFADELPVFFYDSEMQTASCKTWSTFTLEYLNDTYEVNAVGLSEKFVTLTAKCNHNCRVDGARSGSEKHFLDCPVWINKLNKEKR